MRNSSSSNRKLGAGKTWVESYAERHKNDPDFAAEVLALDVLDAVRARMIEIGVSQENLAKRMGVSEAYISKLLNHSRNMTIRSLAHIAMALDAKWTGPVLSAIGSQKRARKLAGSESRKSAATR